MKKRTILLFRLFLFLLILLVCGATALFKSKDYFDQYSNSNSIWDTSLLEYDVKQTSLSFKQLWTMPNVFILVDSLTLGESEIYFMGSLDKNIAPSLVNLNASTGQFKWQMENEPYTNTGLFSNHKYVFASFTGDGRIVAYDLETGVKAFDIQPPGAKTSRILSATESEILVTTSGDNIQPFHIFDANTGVEKLSLSDTPFFFENNIIYKQPSPSSIQAINVEKTNVLWETEFAHALGYPLVVRKMIFVQEERIGLGRVYARIYALEKETGTILWQYNDKPTAGITVDGSILYALSYPNSLIALSTQTGELVGTVDFEPDIVELNGESIYIPIIAVKDSIALVYLESGRQLFAFQYLPNK